MGFFSDNFGGFLGLAGVECDAQEVRGEGYLEYKVRIAKPWGEE